MDHSGLFAAMVIMKEYLDVIRKGGSVMESTRVTMNNDNIIELGNYVLKGNALYRIEDGKEKYVSHAAKVKNVFRPLEDGKIFLEIEFYSFGSGKNSE